MLVAASLLLGVHCAIAVNLTSVYTWPALDYEWPADREPYLRGINYLPGKLKAHYVAVHGDKLFVSLENYGSSVTLVSVSTKAASPPKLNAFPDWPLQKNFECECLQNAQGIEVDSRGRLWVVDGGTYFDCRPKLWIYDTATNDKVEHVHQFPDSVVSYDFFKRKLRGVALDETPDDVFAYITDTAVESIVAFSLKSKLSRVVNTPGLTFETVAVSPEAADHRQLFLGVYSGKQLYSVSVAELRSGAASATPRLVGRFSAMPTRLLVNSANVLLAAPVQRNYITMWDTSTPFKDDAFFVLRNETVPSDPVNAIGQPFSFAYDSKGTFWLLERTLVDGKDHHELLKAD